MLFLIVWSTLLLAMLWLWDRRPVDGGHPNLKVTPKRPQDGA
jgi:hypothetical protein